MKINLQSLLLPLLMVAALVSCSESDDDTNTEYQNWLARNDEYFENVFQTAKASIDAGGEEWLIVKSYSKSGGLTKYTPGADISDAHTNYIVAHVLSQNSDNAHDELTGITSVAALQLQSPLHADTVYVHYRGCLMPSDSYVYGYQFDTSWYGEALNLSTAMPAKFAVNGVVDGFATALQAMHVGDRWDVYIPWQLGYTSATDNIPLYSTLHFDLLLQAFWKPGASAPY